MQHSVKPKEFNNFIVFNSGNLPRIELFARSKCDGWDVWGDEIE
jgi:N6-adenosine-specific RNA methylase IME4